MGVSGKVPLAVAAEAEVGRCASCDPDALAARTDERGRNAYHQQAKRVGQLRSLLRGQIDSKVPCVALRTRALWGVAGPAMVPGSYLEAAFVHPTWDLMA